MKHLDLVKREDDYVRKITVEPATGLVLRSDTIVHKGGNRKIMTPRHSVDIALRIKRMIRMDSHKSTKPRRDG